MGTSKQRGKEVIAKKKILLYLFLFTFFIEFNFAFVFLLWKISFCFPFLHFSALAVMYLHDVSVLVPR